MTTKKPKGNLARQPTERDLTTIAKSIGANWALLAPYLFESNGFTIVSQIKEEEAGTELRIVKLLSKWCKLAGPDATLGLLFHNMLQTETSVQIEWRTIAKDLDIDEREIRACKTGDRRPVQVEQPTQNNVTGETCEDSPVLDIHSQTSKTGNEPPVQGKQTNVTGKTSYERPVQETNTNQQNATDVTIGNDQPSVTDMLPKRTCIYDGRLIKLSITDIEELQNTCKTKIGKGANGEVYRSDGVSRGFGIKIALKMIETTDPQRIKSIQRELNASRILHPFILPLLAVVDHRPRSSEFWTVSPFFENGNLHNAIAGKSVQLKEKDRVKILLQLATAIQYIHTKVPNVRDVILHKDISSDNVVLDLANNARLIDFGLARDLDDKTSHTSVRSLYRHPDYGHRKKATECWDYYSFGVIVREMLTGLGPDGLDGTLLMYMTTDEVCKIFKKNELWSPLGNDRVLNDIAHQCLICVGWTVNEFTTNVVEKIKGIWEPFCQSKIFDVQDSQCHMCMINRKAKETSMTQKHAANCQQEIEVCIACEKNSFLNPITCYCGTKLSPLGSRWGALLIAGNDGNEEMAEALTRDVKELKKLLTSKAPRIVGISENNVRMVTPCHDSNSKEQELLLPKIRENIKYFQGQTEIDTLLIYFSGHCDLNGSSSFMLGSVSEIVALTDFQEMLDDLDKVDKLIIILDRCYPPKINFKKKNRKVIQINACEDSKKANMTEKGSHFTKTLIKGLKGKAERLGCSKDCHFCKEYFAKKSDFITVSSIFEYLEHHIEDPKPRLIQDVSGSSSYIAYFTDEQVEQIDVTEKESQPQKQPKQLRVQLEYFQDIEQLRSKLSEVFGNDETRYRVKVLRDTFRRNERFQECDTIEKVMSVWVQRQPLIVLFESI